MKFKAGLAVLAVSFSFSSLAQTELYVQDLNFIPKAGVLAYQGDISASKTTSERETYDPGSLIKYDLENAEQSTFHNIGYGLTDSLSLFVGVDYVLNDETEINNAEQNGTGFNVAGSPKNSGFENVSVGANWRFLEQNANSINADLKLNYSIGIQDAKRGTFYDSNGDGVEDKHANGNSSQISPEFSIALAGGKKLEQFEVYGLIGFHFVTKGDYKQLKSNTDGSDQKVNRDGYGAFIYQLGAQIKLTEQFFIYGSVTQTVISEVKEDYTDASGDKNEYEGRANINLGLDLGAKIALVPNKVFVFGELHGDASPEQKIVTKTNGAVDNFSDKMKRSTTGRVTVGLLAAF